MANSNDKSGERLHPTKNQQNLDFKAFRKILCQRLTTYNNDLYAFNCVSEFQLSAMFHFITRESQAPSSPEWQTGLYMINAWLIEKAKALTYELDEITEWAELVEVTTTDG
ncbi:MAG: hypothetical protein COA42_20045 [Alteromonadaceae bacterium]|nr:MAG: hypothetical protein COA42_20045 [Alteromonadaceae bacterium]